MMFSLRSLFFRPMSRSDEPRKRRAEHSPCAGGKVPSPDSKSVAHNNDGDNGATEWPFQRLDHGALLALLDQDTALMLLPARKDSFRFVVRGRLVLWPLLCAACRVSGVDVSWERAMGLGGVRVFSPTSHALQKLSVRPHTEAAIDPEALGHRIRQTGAVPMPEDLEQRLRAITEEQQPQFTTAVLLRRCCSAACDVVTSQTKFEAVFNLPGGSCSRQLGFELEPADLQPCVLDFRPLQETAEKVLQLCSDNPRAIIVVIGGKDVGKSTAVRFLLNLLLLSPSSSSFEAAGLLDCDVGQTEMTPAEFLALSKIEKPLFGPPFTHTDQPTLSRCFLGQLSPNDDPRLYFETIEFLYERWKAQGLAAPLIVNTMGWTKGLGRLLLVDTLRLLQPQLVVQLQSDTSTNNYSDLMSSSVVMADRGWVSDFAPIELNYCLLTAQIPRNNWPRPSGRNFSPYDHREATLLGHLAGLLVDEVEVRRPLSDAARGHFLGGNSLLACLTGAVPRKVPWKGLVLHAMNADRQLPAALMLLAMNGALVAMCSLPPDLLEELVIREDNEDLPKTLRRKPLCESLGIGLVRGVDPVTKELLILTGLPQEQLQAVNCLLRGGMDLPTSLGQMSQPAPVPYFEATASSGIGCTGLRKDRPHLQLRKNPH